HHQPLLIGECPAVQFVLNPADECLLSFPGQASTAFRGCGECLFTICSAAQCPSRSVDRPAGPVCGVECVAQSRNPGGCCCVQTANRDVEHSGYAEFVQDRRGEFRIVRISVIERNHHRSSRQLLLSIDEQKNVIKAYGIVVARDFLHLATKQLGGMNNLTERGRMPFRFRHDGVIHQDGHATPPEVTSQAQHSCRFNGAFHPGFARYSHGPNASAERTPLLSLQPLLLRPTVRIQVHIRILAWCVPKRVRSQRRIRPKAPLSTIRNSQTEQTVCPCECFW